jgi:hypothetical protein
VRAGFHGDLAGILVVCDQVKDELPGNEPGSLLSVVAGALNHRNLLHEALSLFAKNTVHPFDAAS